MPDENGKWRVWKLAALLYPFVVLTVAINLFFAGLIARSAGWTELTLTPVAAVLWSIPLGVPFGWAAGLWVRRLMDQADS